MGTPANRLGERLVQAGYITRQQLNEAISLQKTEGGMLGDNLVRFGYITPSQLSDFLYGDKFSRLGELLLQDGLITPKQLNRALDFQVQNGGRLGNICVQLGFLSEDALDGAIRRHRRDRSRLGEILVHDGVITPEQLAEAIKMQQRSGGQLGEILLFLRYVNQDTLCRELATQFEIGRAGESVDFAKIRNIPYEMADKYQALIIAERKDSFLLAVRDHLDDAVIKKIEAYAGKPVEQVLATPKEMDGWWNLCFKNTQRHKSIFNLYETQPENSAIVTFSTPQLVAFIAIGLLILAGCLVSWIDTFFAVNLVVQALYAVMTVLKFCLVLRGENRNMQLHFTEEDLSKIDERELPVYTVLIPVYHEAEVIETLLHHIAQMDYPKYKLDVRILLEEDDKETITAVKKLLQSEKAGIRASAVLVPKSQPQTKPKACNYGLLQAKGRYIVIYDAEDRPEPDQLKKAYLAFKTLPEEYVCVQAKLNYYNSEQNFLTRLFTQEYSMWFEDLLVGVMQMNIPVPLGGTSNHFKMSFLRKVGGWDPFNVTEDADLGIRLFKFRYKTIVLDSCTWEEANSSCKGWIRQRSRWIKGYMQTWLVHMRHPVKLYRELGLRGTIGYHAMIFGTPFLPLVNPILWLMTILWFVTKAWWIQFLFPGYLYYIGMVQLIFGNFMFTYINLMGVYSVIHSGNRCRKANLSYALIKYGLLTPVYWALMSIAAYKALFQLLKHPFYWEKTMHGLDLPEKQNTAGNS